MATPTILNLLHLGRLRPQAVSHTVRTVRTENIGLRCGFVAHGGPVNGISIEQHEHRYLLTAGADCAIHIFDLSDIDSAEPFPVCSFPRERGHTKGVVCVEWYPRDNGMFFSGSHDGTVVAWDANQGQKATTYVVGDHVFGIGLHPVSSNAPKMLIAVASSEVHIPILDPRTATPAFTLKGHNNAVNCVEWCPSESTVLASASADCTVRLWDLRRPATGISLPVVDGDVFGGQAHVGAVKSLKYSRDGLELVTVGHEGVIHLWNTHTFTSTPVTFSHIPKNSRPRSGGMRISISPDGEYLFVPSGRAVDMFQIRTGLRHASLKMHFDRVNGCAVNPITQEVISCSDDRMVVVWSPPECGLTASTTASTHSSTPVTQAPVPADDISDWGSDAER